MQNEDWLSDEHSGIPGGRGAGGGGGGVTQGQMVFFPKPPPHGTLVAPLQENRPRQPPPAHMLELLLKSQPYLTPSTHGVVDWPVVSLTVQLLVATTSGLAASTANNWSARAAAAAISPSVRPPARGALLH